MKSRWNEEAAPQSPLELRVYSAQLLGMEPDLVLHGGGNTSVKGEQLNIFAEPEKLLFVKGSGWDLRTIETEGFPAVSLSHLLRLGELEQLSDSEMMRQLRRGLLDPAAPTPSVEAILHAIIPHKFVDHSHADAVVGISNTPHGEKILKEIFGPRVLILPYIMPGFILARQVAAIAKTVDWQQIDGLVLLHHGLFTFSDDARLSYERMLELVSKAEDYLKAKGAMEKVASASYLPNSEDCLQLSRLRLAASQTMKAPVLLRFDHSKAASGFANLPNCAELTSRGPLTPDHTIHSKGFAAFFEQDPVSGLENFGVQYREYFDKYAGPDHQILDVVPRYGVWKDKGLIYLAADLKRLNIVADITEHTVKAIQWGEALGAWQALPPKDLFDVEYWELEQAKLKSSKKAAELTGKIALVTGAASGIGKASVEHLVQCGAVVVALDINPDLQQRFADQADVLTITVDITDQQALAAAIERAVVHFGGVDIVVSNAGTFPASARLEVQSDELWEHSLNLNLSSHMRLIRTCLPYLKNGINPAIVFVGSKNVSAPGPGAAAYSAAKAGLNQLARVAALELGEHGIRVNTVHPNGVFDTGIWSEAIVAERAKQYGLSVSDYQRNNVLKTRVSSADVATLIGLLAGNSLSKTTGAQIPVDGGNERVI